MLVYLKRFLKRLLLSTGPNEKTVVFLLLLYFSTGPVQFSTESVCCSSKQ